ncbi:FAD-binding protein [Nostoc sp. XA013]|nr:FAD-binding protein [Nostoc sp. XA013]
MLHLFLKVYLLLDGILYTDNATLTDASIDFGNIVHRQPIAVFKPGSIEDIVQVIQFARTHKLKVAPRGQGHSVYGQSQEACAIGDHLGEACAEAIACY